MIHSQDPDKLCDCDSIKDGALREGCKHFKSLYWANPVVDYEIVECPTELKQHPPCWHENGNRWPSTKPAKCATGYKEFFENEEDAQTPIDEVDAETIVEETVASETTSVEPETITSETTTDDAILM